MSYTRHTWASGDVVSAARLNNIEDGIEGGGGLVVTATKNGDTWTLDKTAGEIYQAFTSGMAVILTKTDVFDGTDVIYHHILACCQMDDGGYNYVFVFFDYNYSFVASSSSSYPSYTSGDIM